MNSRKCLRVSFLIYHVDKTDEEIRIRVLRHVHSKLSVLSVEDREPQAWNEVESDSNTKIVKAQTLSFIRKEN